MLNRPGRRGRRAGVPVDPMAVRTARLESGLSLADVAGGQVSRTAIHLVEVGKMKPSLETLQLIAEKTGKPLAAFMPAGPMPASHSPGLDELEQAAAQNDFERVIAIGDELMREKRREADEALIEYSLGRARVQRGEGQAALALLEDALARYKRLGDQLGCVECTDQIACAYFRLDDPRSMPMAEEALRACRELRPVPRQLESRILGNLAAMHGHSRRWRQAVYFYEECLKAGSDVLNLRHRALTYDGLSLASQRLGNLGAATTYAHKAIALYELESDIASIALAENNLADILMKSGNLADAERHVLTALRLCEDNGLRRPALTYGLLTLGEIHQLRHQPDAADILGRAIEAAQEQGQLVPVAAAHQLLGRIASSESRDVDAIREFETATSLLERVGMPERLRDCLLEYATLVEASGGDAAGLWKRAALAGADRPPATFEAVAAQDGRSAG